MRSQLRRIYYRFGERDAAKRAARVERGKYKCAGCNEVFGAREVQVDHIEPVINPKKGFEDWHKFIVRLFVDRTGLQVLCLTCHDLKTAMEAGVRAFTRRNK